MLEKIALGTVQFGLDYGISNKHGKVSLEEGLNIINAASTYGISTLDTAIGYGDSEKNLGKIGVKGWDIVTKLPGYDPDLAEPSLWVENSIKKSLSNLNVEQLYGVLFHCTDDLLSKHGAELFGAVLKLKEKGVIKKVGISAYDSAEINSLTKLFPIELIQVPHNIFDRRLTENGLFSQLSDKGIEIHVRSVFLQGLLLMNKDDRPHKFNRWEQLWNNWDEWLVERKMSPLQACLSYALSIREISKVVIGVESLNQLKDIASLTTIDLTEIPEKINCNDALLLNPAAWASF